MKPFIKQILFSLAAALLVTAIIALGVLNRVDKWTQDSLFQHPGMTSTDIVIIGIDDDTLDMLGPYNTDYRLYVAKALETMAKDPDHLPAVVCIDILYDGENDPETDARLAKAAEEIGCVVTATMARFGEKITWENGRAVSMDTTAVLDYEQPFDALKAVEFKYDTSWNMLTLADDQGTPFEFYLAQGEHTIRLEATLGEMGVALPDELLDAVAGGTHMPSRPMEGWVGGTAVCKRCGDTFGYQYYYNICLNVYGENGSQEKDRPDYCPKCENPAEYIGR